MAMTAPGSKLPVRRDQEGPGRPRYSDAVRKKLLNGLRMGMTRRAACGWAGINVSTIYEWVKDEAFALQVEEAENYAEAHYTATIRAVATPSMPPAVRLRASEFWLDRRRPAEWRERLSVEVTLPGEVEEARNRDLDEIKDELRALAQEALRRGGSRSADDAEAGGSGSGSS